MDNGGLSWEEIYSSGENYNRSAGGNIFAQFNYFAFLVRRLALRNYSLSQRQRSREVERAWTEILAEASAWPTIRLDDDGP